MPSATKKKLFFTPKLQKKKYFYQCLLESIDYS